MAIGKRIGLGLRIVQKTAGFLLVVLGTVFLIFLLLSLTTRPFFMHYKLGTGLVCDSCEPTAIVVFGASGIPSGASLVRLFYAAQLHEMYPHTPIHICMTGDTADAKSAPVLMAKELEIRGVEAGKIELHGHGKNTRSQVLELMEHEHGMLKNDCLAVVTSPSHMRRCLLALKCEGFELLVPCPAFEAPLEGELLYDDSELGGRNRIPIPQVGQNLGLRYKIWNQMGYLLECSREYVALSYYWLRGWI